MEYKRYIEELNLKYPTFENFRAHVHQTLHQRGQIKAEYTRLTSNYRHAGVLITLAIPKEIVELDLAPLPYLHIIFEKRSDKMKSHPGQMAFPGGTIEDQDNGSIVKAAFREAEEEVGINQESLELISMFDQFTSSSKILVEPVVAWLKVDLDKTDFGIALTEKYYPRTQESVATVVMPVYHLLNPNYYRSRPYYKAGKEVGMVRFFNTTEIRPNDTIWGLTAAVTKRLLDSLFPNNLLVENQVS